MVAIKLPDGSILNMEDGINGLDYLSKGLPNECKIYYYRRPAYARSYRVKKELIAFETRISL